ncbi:MAG: alanine--tRNA ligase [Phycisphaerales bacterium]|nr:alanine--tRNA ligase [Phycisphaerales bacterium]
MTRSQDEKTSTHRSAEEIRRDFMDFFAEKAGHTIVPSSAVVPHDDPTLLFTNAGMNQFKDVFLGQGERPYKRAVDTQKCIRAGGKHNDLEDVGRDTYHHTFFEMLGNWSFGDYFKEDAIKWAWQLLTEVWGLPAERLHVTVFEGSSEDGTEPDEEAHELWLRHTSVNPENITRWGRKDNFWEMGATGPCGPCSEIHYDGTPDGDGGKLVNLDHPDVIEIWNLVFIQFNRRADGALVPLPSKHVDTGMGFERIVRVLQDKSSNYDTDLWTPLFDAIQHCSEARPYGNSLDDPIDVAYRVIADHVRCVTIALADGARPGNEGRSYVLRRILRRAVRMVHQTLGVHEPMLCRIVPAVAASLGGVFPELQTQQDTVASIIRDEEEAFLRTLERGLALFDTAAQGATDGNLSGEDAFALHDTFGFPIDLTELMCRERDLEIDRATYDELMESARERSRASSNDTIEMTLPPDAIARLAQDGVGPTDDRPKFEGGSVQSRIMAIWDGNEFKEHVETGTFVGLILDSTSFYADQGGQIGDTGHYVDGDSSFQITQTRRFGDYVLHEGTGEGLDLDSTGMACIDQGKRDRIEANHTGTHLLNLALRSTLGEDVQQKGSLVSADRLRFDFSCRTAPTSTQLERIESDVRDSIEQGQVVHAAEMPLESAMKITGVRAVFGERYPDPVRVVSIGAASADLVERPEDPQWMEHSIEFCGGTHLDNTSNADSFLLIQEQGLAAGIRRMTALTGMAAREALDRGRQLSTDVQDAASCEDLELADRIDVLTKRVDEETLGLLDREQIRKLLESLRARVKAARKSAAKSSKNEAVAIARSLSEASEGDVIVGVMEGVIERDDLLAAMDTIRGSHPDSACMLLGTDLEAGKVVMVARVPEALIKRGLKAGNWIKHVASLCGGGGGGRPDMAQAGGSKPECAQEAATNGTNWAKEQLT